MMEGSQVNSGVEPLKLLIGRIKIVAGRNPAETNFNTESISTYLAFEHEGVQLVFKVY